MRAVSDSLKSDINALVKTGFYNSGLSDPQKKSAIISKRAASSGQAKKTIYLTEYDRETTTIRVYSPDDATVYIDVDVITKVMSNGNDGNEYIQVFDEPVQPPPP